MDSRVDRVKAKKEVDKGVAIRFVQIWVIAKLECYEEPVRAGTPKGEPIGFSREKYAAALWMALYPWCLKLKDIAKRAEVSQSSLRVWKTNEKFLQVVEKEGRALGEVIARTITQIIYKRFKEALEEEGKKVIEEEVEELCFKFTSVSDSMVGVRQLVSALPFLNVFVVEPVLDMVKEHLDISDSRRIAFINIGLKLHELASVHDEKSLRKWRVRPEILELTKSRIRIGIEYLANPETWKNLSIEEIKKWAEEIKEMIFQELDILAS